MVHTLANLEYDKAFQIVIISLIKQCTARSEELAEKPVMPLGHPKELSLHIDYPANKERARAGGVYL